MHKPVLGRTKKKDGHGIKNVALSPKTVWLLSQAVNHLGSGAERLWKVDMGLSENVGYIPNYSHLMGIMISKTIGCRGTNHFQTNPHCIALLQCLAASHSAILPLFLKVRGLEQKTTAWTCRFVHKVELNLSLTSPGWIWAAPGIHPPKHMLRGARHDRLQQSIWERREREKHGSRKLPIGRCFRSHRWNQLCKRLQQLDGAGISSINLTIITSLKVDTIQINTVTLEDC